MGEAALHPAASEASIDGLDAFMRAMVPALVEGRPPTEADLLSEGEPGRAALAALDGARAALSAASGAGSTVGADAPGRDVDRGQGAGLAIPVVATIAFGGPDAGGESAAQAVELGFGTLSLRAGHERHNDHLVDRVRAIRAAVGPGPRLRIEVGGAWDLETAAERIGAIERFGIEFVEQPLPARDVTGHAALRERVGVPIALDESVESEGAAAAAIAERAADVLVLKPARLGGAAPPCELPGARPTQAWTSCSGSYFETGVGIAAALRIAAALGRHGGRARPAELRHTALPPAGSWSTTCWRTRCRSSAAAWPFPAR